MKKQIVCFGDSNTWGYNAQDGSRFEEHIRWPGVLAQSLGSDFNVIEEGLSGRTAVLDDPLFDGLNGFTYLTPCLKSHSPLNIVIIMLGTNDTKERFQLTAFNIAQGIIRIAKKAQQSESGPGNNPPHVVVVCPPIIGENYFHTSIGAAMGANCHLKSEALPNYLAQLCHEEKIDYLDASSIPMNTIDFMHLSVEGHKLLGELVFNKVQSIIL